MRTRIVGKPSDNWKLLEDSPIVVWSNIPEFGHYGTASYNTVVLPQESEDED